MLFSLQKIIWSLVLPPTDIILIMLAGYFLMNKYRRTGRVLVFTGIGLLYLLSLAQVADLIVKPLERDFPPLAYDTGMAIDAVVVPGGGSTDLEWLGAEPQPNAETLSRLVTGVQIARTCKVPLVLCGGNGEPFLTKVHDADAMVPAAAALGMPREKMIVERESRNTLENSHAVRRLIKGNRIVLATSAYYMRRARAMFERRGFTVIPAPTYYLCQTKKLTLVSLIPSSGNLARSTTGLAEWAGLAWWTLRGEV